VTKPSRDISSAAKSRLSMPMHDRH
jgi:hypothetical protein